MNRGSLGVRELNTALQKVLNPVQAGEPNVERFGWRFQMRDKVIQTENDYDKEVFNGDTRDHGKHRPGRASGHDPFR
jgi:exodeoxyribonuclease V alpha subunit